MTDSFKRITLKLWHGGVFETVNGELCYRGGIGRTFDIDPDELCWFYLVELVAKCKKYANRIKGFFYLLPGKSMGDGLRKALNDDNVREMIKVGLSERCLEVFVLHGDNNPKILSSPSKDKLALMKCSSSQTQTTSTSKKLTVKRGPPLRSSPRKKTQALTIKEVRPQPTSLLNPKADSHKKAVDSSSSHPPKDALVTQSKPKKIFTSKQNTPKPHTPTIPHSVTHIVPTNSTNSYEWEDNRPESPIPINQLIGGYSSESDKEDPSYNPQVDKGKSVDKGFFLEVYTDEDTYDTDEEGCEELGGEGGGEELGGEVGGEDLGGEISGEDLGGEVGGEDLGGEIGGEDLGRGGITAEEVDDLECLDEELENEREEILNEELEYQSESDEEYFEARERVRDTTSRLVDIARQCQKEASKCLDRLQEGETVEASREELVEDSSPHSDYEASDDEINTPPDSGDEDLATRRKKKAGLLVSKNTDFAKFTWKVGQRFANREDFRSAVAKYGVLQGRNVYFKVSCNKRQQRLGVRCIDTCPFYVYASWNSRIAAIIVKTVKSEHTCQRNMKRNRQLKTTWVAQQFLEVFKTRPHWPAKEIQQCIRKAFKMLVSRDFAYKVKYKAHKMLHGSMHEHYNKVGGYMAALQSSSPGSHLDLVTETEKQQCPPIFKRLFIGFEGLKIGWLQGCRRVLAVDACFLKTFLGGQLMCAVGRDKNDQMYPVCWAVVEGENNSSREWFFRKLHFYLDLKEGEGMAIISDEHQSILHGVSTVLPKAEHRHCARHIFSHWHKQYRGDEMKLCFWKIAKAYNMADYNEAIEELAAINIDAANDFKAHNPEVFCRAFLNPEIKTDAITSNIAETFNGYIIQARTKHLLYMLEDIRSALMQRLVVKRQSMMTATTTILCPRIQAKLDHEKEKAADCEVMPSSDTLFNVTYCLDQLVVNLETRSCTCRRWDMLGIPCRHAVASIYFLGKEAEQYVDECYYKETYLKAYAGSIPPCEGERHWPKVSCPINPPPIKIGPGRPRKNRIKDPFENPKKAGTITKNGVEMTCSLCKVKGHNKRKCPQKDTITLPPPLPKRPRGRPRRDEQPTTTPSSNPEPDTSHHTLTAQPSIIGRGGRMITRGRGSRGGRGRGTAAGSSSGRGTGEGCTSGRARGRGRNQVPTGVGVLFAQDGSVITAGGPTSTNRRTRSSSAMESFQISQSSQTSTLHQPTQ